MASVTEKRGVFYAVIYEGRNPVSGRERRRWHRCEDHAAASKLATELTDWRRSQRTALAAAGVVNEQGLVFTRPDGKPLHRTRCPRRSTVRNGDSTCPQSDSTTFATPTPACCCATGFRSRSSPNDSATRTRRSR